MDVTNQISLFRNFLNVAWPSLDSLMKTHDWGGDVWFTSDWIQINWEYLVEREILGKNDGSLTTFSLTDGNEKIIPHHSNCVYGVIAYPKKNCEPLDVKKNIKPPFNKGLKLFSLLTFKGYYPPFDLAHLVLDSPRELFIVPFAELDFHLSLLK